MVRPRSGVVRPSLYVVGFIEGHTLLPGQPQLDPKGINRLAREGIRALFALHQLDWRSRQEVWGEPFDFTEEFKRLDYLLDRPTLDPEMVRLAPKLRERLRSTMPAEPRSDRARRLPVVKPAHEGWRAARGCRLGTVADRRGDDRSGMVLPVLRREIAGSATACGRSIACRRRKSPRSTATRHSDQRPTKCGGPALAGYRFGVITVFNVMLHRRGKRIDPLWEEIGRSGSRLFERRARVARLGRLRPDVLHRPILLEGQLTEESS